MLRIFGAPPLYIQGPGALSEVGRVARSLGTSACVIVDVGVFSIVEAAVDASLTAAGVTFRLLPYAGEITFSAIERLVAEARHNVPGVVVAIGGGKGLDVGKGVAERLGVPTITVPTIASNDAPTSATYAVYNDAHVMVGVERMVRNPAAVLVDTALIAKAPARFLRAGIGDALSKKFEAEGCAAGTGITPFGTRPLLIGAVIADAGYWTLRTHAVAALEAVERQETNPALEATVEACILMSGLGFENGGLSLAHAMTRGLVKARGVADASHGEQVAYATLVQVTAERRPDSDVLDLMRFVRAVGLPVRLADFGMAGASDAEIAAIAHWTMTAPHIPNLPLVVTADDVAAAMRRVERLAEANLSF